LLILVLMERGLERLEELVKGSQAVNTIEGIFTLMVERHLVSKTLGPPKKMGREYAAQSAGSLFPWLYRNSKLGDF